MEAPLEVAVIVPTLGRPSLDACLASIKAQTFKNFQIVVKNGPGDMVTKIRQGLSETTSKYVAVADDDATYPPDWMQNLLSAFGPGIGFAGGPCTAPIGKTWKERAIFLAASSSLGTTTKAYRPVDSKGAAVVNGFDLSMNGLWLRVPYEKIITQEWQDIPPGNSEWYALARLRQMGFSTVYVPSGFCWHSPRTYLTGFVRQGFRAGASRVNLFRVMPSQALVKPQIFAPALLVGGLFLLPFMGPGGIIILLMYPAAVFGTATIEGQLGMLLTLPLEHLSYGLGMWYGLFKEKRTWS
jgi:hypothetical protein